MHWSDLVIFCVSVAGLLDPVLKMMIDVAVPKVAGAKGNSSSGFQIVCSIPSE